jgi:plastocyanin
MGVIGRLVVGFVLLIPGPLGAADLVVQVSDGDGRPVADAVVTLAPQGGQVRPAAPAPQPLIIDQRNETFIPYVQIVPRGGEVAFRNSDLTRHHVYSFSPVRAFEFVLAPGEQSVAVRFERLGMVAVGCNIHDQMVAYLFVTDLPWSVLTDRDGRATLTDVPEAAYELQTWHPRLRPGRREPVQTVTIAAGANRVAVSVALLREANREHDRERARYR